MRKQVAVKLAVSALALTTTLVACNPAAMAYRPGAAAQATGDKKAVDAFQKAQGFASAGNLASATNAAEEAVSLAPRDVGYRMLLADLYLKTGRFQSAETTYADVLKLDPDNKRAGLRVALSEVALGRAAGAVASLDRIADSASPGDLGLAYALAGKTERAIGILEAAARAPGADGRVRQNLALAYALSGDWAKARTTAAQDVSPDQLNARLQNWAALANPSAGADKVAALFGTHAVTDPGQPTRLALADPTPQRLAAAEPAPEPAPVAAATLAPETKPAEPAFVQVAIAQEPVTIAAPAAPAVPAGAKAAAAQPTEVTRPVYADAVQALVRAPVGPAKIKLASVRPFDVAPRHSLAPAAHHAYAGPGKYAVQLGAFSSPAAVERAWAQAYRRYGFAEKTPLSTTVNMPGRGTFHRLSVAGFDSRASADRICAAVRSHGGACFVRAVAGDAPVRWASRYTSSRQG